MRARALAEAYSHAETIILGKPSDWSQERWRQALRLLMQELKEKYVHTGE